MQKSGGAGDYPPPSLFALLSIFLSDTPAPAKEIISTYDLHPMQTEFCIFTTPWPVCMFKLNILTKDILTNHKSNKTQRSKLPVLRMPCSYHTKLMTFLCFFHVFF